MAAQEKQERKETELKERKKNNHTPSRKKRFKASYTWREKSLITGVSIVTLGGFLFCFVMIFLMSSIQY